MWAMNLVCVPRHAKSRSGTLKIGAIGTNWALPAFRLRPLANLLPMTLQQKVRAGSRVKRFGYLCHNPFLHFPVVGAIVLSFVTANDANRNMDAIGGHGRERCDPCKQQNPVCSGIRNAMKSLQSFPRRRKRSC